MDQNNSRRHWLLAAALTGYSMAVGAQPFVFGEDLYCSPFDPSVCKKGDLIVVPVSRDVLKYCDIDRPLAVEVTPNSRVVCRYMGSERANRMKR
jgi:hypothetical protein